MAVTVGVEVPVAVAVRVAVEVAVDVAVRVDVAVAVEVGVGTVAVGELVEVDVLVGEAVGDEVAVAEGNTIAGTPNAPLRLYPSWEATNSSFGPKGVTVPNSISARTSKGWFSKIVFQFSPRVGSGQPVPTAAGDSVA